MQSIRKVDDKMNDIKEYTTKLFEDIKHIDEFGNEYWLARELQNILEYTQWRRFENVINKAKFACKNSNIKVDEHFANVGKMVTRCGPQNRVRTPIIIIARCLLVCSACHNNLLTAFPAPPGRGRRKIESRCRWSHR